MLIVYRENLRLEMVRHREICEKENGDGYAVVRRDDATDYDGAEYAWSSDEVFFVIPGGGGDGSVRERG